MIRKIFLIFLLLFLHLFSVALGEDYGGYGGAFLQLSIAPRAAAMGNAYTAVSDDASGVFFNPGAAAQVKRVSISGAYRDMSLQRSLQQLAVLFPIRGEAAIGFSAEIATMGEIIGRNSRGESTEELDNLDAVFSIIFSRRFSRFFSVGGNIRYYHKKLESTSAYSAGFDAGGMVHLDREDVLAEEGPIDLIRFGAVVRNIAAKYPWNTGDYWAVHGERGTDATDNVPIIIRVGGSIQMFNRKLLLAIDGEKDEKKSAKLNVGGEYWLIRTCALRAGLTAGRPAFGAGFAVPVGNVDIQIDIAVEEALNIGGWESMFGFAVLF